MTIRRLLLVAFLLVSLVPSTALTLLAFERTRTAMLGEIEQGVLRSAAALSAEMEKVLHERLLNATTWNHLEVMQDLRLDDVDKRLSGFLAEMKQRYGDTYLALHATAPDGRIVASSEPARIGQRFPESAPWFQTQLPGGQIRLDRPQALPGQRRRLVIRSPIPSRFTEGTLGSLVLEFDWGAIQRILDLAADAHRQLLVLDGQGRVIGASRALALAPGTDLRAWLPSAPAAGVTTRDGRPLMAAALIVGHDRSRPLEHFSGFGWHYLLLQSRDVALQPVTRMAWSFAGLLAVTLLASVLVSLSIAAAIARPVVALTEFTRRYAGPGERPSPPASGPREVGELTRSFVTLMDDLQRSQHTLTQASRLAALGEVTALLAHEVRTPLGILRSSAQTLQGETGISAEGRELLQIIDSETGRLNRLIGALLDSTRTRQPQFARADVHGLVRHAASLLAAQARDRRVRLDLRLDAREPIIDVDAEQLTQVLLNLIMNALQILPPGGHVEVATRDDADRLAIDVADDGPGIAPEERNRLFEPFVYKREGGLGLGLAVVRQILRQHGGDVVAGQSHLGGALFQLWLPRERTRTA